MSMNDPIGDMLTRIRNALKAGHVKVDVPASKLKKAIVEILKSEGYIRSFRNIGEGKQGFIRLYFKKEEEVQKCITNLRRVSRPGLRVYVGKEKLPKVLGGLGTAVISTSRGLLTDRSARKAGVGGEHLFNIW
jgi:small subunit ribosomal protein S8